MNRIINILFLLISVVGFSQNPKDNINFKKFNTKFLEELIEQKINEKRVSSLLVKFKQDNILQLAAADQSEHIIKTGKVEHEQPNKKKLTPFDRVVFYDGLHAEVGENCMQTVLGAKVKIPGTNNRLVLKTYEDAAEAFVSAWVNAKESPQVVLNKSYYNVGTSVSFDAKSKKIVATQVYGSEPFILPNGIKAERDDYKIEPYNKDKCAELEKNFPYLPELMSDNIFYKNGQLYFFFHDLELFKNVMSAGNDAIAIDVISRSQFSCETGNRLYPSKIHSGMLLPPVNKNYLLSKNELKDQGQLEVSLGPIPSYIDTNNVEFTLLIIKSNCLCQTIVYNSLAGDNLKSLNLGFIVDTLSVSNKADSVLNTLTFTVPFERNKFDYKMEDIEPFLDSISLNRYDLKKIDILAYSSIEGNQKDNKILQEKRANSILKIIKNYKLQEVQTAITTEENWDGFFNSIKGSPYEKQFFGLTKEQILKIVNTDTLALNMEPYLEDQRKAIIKLTVEKIYMDTTLYEGLPAKFKQAIKTKDYKKAKIYQSILFSAVKDGKINAEEVLKLSIPHYKETVSLINNQIAFRWYYNDAENRDSLNEQLLKELNIQSLIDPLNPYVNYNKASVKLLLWSEDYTRETDPKNLLKEIKQLYGTDIEPYRVHQLLLNHNIISADYYYEAKKFKERDKSLLEVKKMLLQSQLTKEQVVLISDYFIFQMRISWAIELMKPWVERPDIDEDFLFSFITIAVYDTKLVPEQEYIALLLRAKNMNLQRFCKLFGYPNMSFQLLKNNSIKKSFCETCR
ncbi:MAG: CAP domain-containing protein [Flavobacteriales bacterium]